MLTLKRFYRKNFTMGKIEVEDFCDIDTLELPYINNKENISCIPEGKYLLKTHKSPKFGDCIKVFEKDATGKLQEVNGRKDILIHSGNAVKDFSFYNKYKDKTTFHCDTRGCLLVGFGLFEVIDDIKQHQAYIAGSKKALTFLNEYLATEKQGEIELLITKGESHE